MLRRRFGKTVLAMMLFAFICAPLSSLQAAEKFPSRYVTLLHGYPGAGMAEANNQIIAKALKKQLGVDVIVEGKAGGGGVELDAARSGTSPAQATSPVESSAEDWSAARSGFWEMSRTSVGYARAAA